MAVATANPKSSLARQVLQDLPAQLDLKVIMELQDPLATAVPQDFKDHRANPVHLAIPERRVLLATMELLEPLANPATTAKRALLATTALLVFLVLPELLAKMVILAALDPKDLKANLDHKATPSRPRSPAHLAHLATLAKTELLVTLAAQDQLVQSARKDLPVNLANPAPTAILVDLVLKVILAILATPGLLAKTVFRALPAKSLAHLDLKVLLDPLATLALLVKTVSQADLVSLAKMVSPALPDTKAHQAFLANLVRMVSQALPVLLATLAVLDPKDSRANLEHLATLAAPAQSVQSAPLDQSDQ